jgi:hypothetical protein
MCLEPHLEQRSRRQRRPRNARQRGPEGPERGAVPAGLGARAGVAVGAGIGDRRATISFQRGCHGLSCPNRSVRDQLAGAPCERRGNPDRPTPGSPG